MTRVLLIAIALFVQATPPADVSVLGHVDKGELSRLDPRTSVVLVSGATHFRADVNPDGTFAFMKVKPGTYDVFVDDNAMPVETILASGIPSIRLTVGKEHISGLRLIAPRHVTVQGTGIIEGGRPMPRFSLWLTKKTEAAFFSRKFDVGRVVYVSVHPGKYNVTAEVPSGFVLRSITAGDVDLRTEPLIVTDNGVRNLSVVLDVDPAGPSPFVQVRGRFTGGDVAAYVRTTIGMSGPAMNESLTSLLDPEGRFGFPMVRPGTYSLEIYSMPELSSNPAIAIGVGSADLSDLEIPMPLWHEVAGRVVLEDPGAMPKAISFSLGFPNGASVGSNGRPGWTHRDLLPGAVIVTPLASLGRRAELQPDGRFKVRLPVGERRLQVRSDAIPGYVLSAASYGWADILTSDLTVTSTDKVELVLKFKRQ